MPKLPVMSGQQAVRVFQRVGFQVRRREGSHIVMVKEGFAVTLSVLDHRELKSGTLRSLVRKSGLTVGEFLVLLGR